MLELSCYGRYSLQYSLLYCTGHCRLIQIPNSDSDSTNAVSSTQCFYNQIDQILHPYSKQAVSTALPHSSTKKFNMEPENKPLEKETCFANHHFLVAC